MTLLEAAKQALDALEELSGTGILYKETPFQAYMRVRQMADLPISLLSQAIEQAEKQEPVAWELRQGKTDRVLIEITNNRLKAYDWQCSREEVVPLYAAPPQQEPQIAFNSEVVGYVQPQREWVGLTDDEISDIWFAYGPRETINGYHFARAIEDKFLGKNK